MPFSTTLQSAKYSKYRLVGTMTLNYYEHQRILIESHLRKKLETAKSDLLSTAELQLESRPQTDDYGRLLTGLPAPTLTPSTGLFSKEQPDGVSKTIIND